MQETEIEGKTSSRGRNEKNQQNHKKMAFTSNEKKKQISTLEGNLHNSKIISSGRLEIIVQWIGSYFISTFFNFLEINLQQIITKNSILIKLRYNLFSLESKKDWLTNHHH